MDNSTATPHVHMRTCAHTHTRSTSRHPHADTSRNPQGLSQSQDDTHTQAHSNIQHITDSERRMDIQTHAGTHTGANGNKNIETHKTQTRGDRTARPPGTCAHTHTPQPQGNTASSSLIAVRAWLPPPSVSGPKARAGGAGDFRGQEGKGVELQLGALGAVITRCRGCHAGWDFPPSEDKATRGWPL